MKIAVTSQGTTLEDQIDPRFGRCANFVIVETDTMSCKTLANDNMSASGGAGIQAAQLVARENVKVVLTGHCGPNAFRTLDAAGIVVITDLSGTVRNAVEDYKAGRLAATDGPTVASHAGTAL